MEINIIRLISGITIIVVGIISGPHHSAKEKPNIADWLILLGFILLTTSVNCVLNLN